MFNFDTTATLKDYYRTNKNDSLWIPLMVDKLRTNQANYVLKNNMEHKIYELRYYGWNTAANELEKELGWNQIDQ